MPLQDVRLGWEHVCDGIRRVTPRGDAPNGMPADFWLLVSIHICTKCASQQLGAKANTQDAASFENVSADQFLFLGDPRWMLASGQRNRTAEHHK